MRVLVCVKHVPDTTEVRFDPATGELKVRQAPTKINDYDKHALEAAARMREATGVEVVIGCVGPPEAGKTLKEAMAFGADRAVLVSGPWTADIDAAGTAEVLVALAQREGPFDLVLSGDVSEDGYHSLVPGLVAAALGVPFVRGVTAFEVHDGAADVTRLSGEVEENYHLTLPSVLSVTRILNEPRNITTLQVMKVPMSKVRTVGAGDLGVDETRLAPERLATRVLAVRPAAQTRRREIISGEPDDVVRTLVAKLEDSGVLK